MKFLPKAKAGTPLERYTEVGKLENYIENTKRELADNLPEVCSHVPPNITFSQRTALSKLRHAENT